MESCVVELDGLHRQLCAETAAAPGPAHRSVSTPQCILCGCGPPCPIKWSHPHLLQEEPACLMEVVSTLTLLKNLMHSSEETKVSGGIGCYAAHSPDPTFTLCDRCGLCRVGCCFVSTRCGRGAW